MFEGGLYPYWIVIFLMMTGLYVVISRDNLVKKVIGLNVLRVMREAEAVAARLQTERPASTAQIELLDGWDQEPPWREP